MSGTAGDGGRQPVAFISHHSSQVETARKLKCILGENDIRGWMAPDDIDPGRPFDQAIIEQVRASDLIILLFCSRSDRSRHVKRELMMAENGDKLIFPVRLENIDADGLAYWLNDYQWVDWIDRRDATIQKMITTIKRIVQIAAPREEPAPPPDAPAEAVPVAEAPPPPLPNKPSAPKAREPEGAGQPLNVAPAPMTLEPESGDGGPPSGFDRRRMLLFGGLALLAVLVVLALVFLWPGGEESEDPAARGVLSSSVDCGDVALPSHGIICGSDALAARETAIGEAYERAMLDAEGRSRVELQQGQADFLARRDECRSEACLAIVYDAREEELEQVLGEEIEAPEEVPDADGEENPARPEPRDEPAAQDRPSPSGRAEPSPSQPEPRPAPEPAPSRGVATTPPQPANNPASWVQVGDYPSDILRNGEQGTTRYQVSVGANGLPTNCFTIGTSGHWQLDARACRRVMSRARFQPARDASGNAVSGVYAGSYRWVAPN
ncbi:TonB family protein [Parasphingopyxis marina]|uniref:TonB family protein n=1 Tax=Parasphingopyxis marina TaxID=2761622 RepID=A0A842HXG2_9SPHN|nr:TonB family protein [Parasphingopyxis marina]MBC2777117.1 TonB family protein [Parasphingopyxis marina]